MTGRSPLGSPALTAHRRATSSLALPDLLQLVRRSRRPAGRQPIDLGCTQIVFSCVAGSDLAAETAAALAAVSLVTRESDPEYSARCLLHARQLYRFATLHRGLYHEAIKGAAQFYE